MAAQGYAQNATQLAIAGKEMAMQKLMQQQLPKTLDAIDKSKLPTEVKNKLKEAAINTAIAGNSEGNSNAYTPQNGGNNGGGVLGNYNPQHYTPQNAEEVQKA
ncbi:MAG: hypothetical protein ACKVTZ_03315, partial [Bacteroidia bacterium]